MVWNQEDFNDFIIENGIIGFFKEPLKLKSGRQSFWYVNWRNVAEDVYSLEKLSDFIIAFVKNLNLEPACFYGVPEGATKLGIITQYKWAKDHLDYKKNSHILSMGRAKPKEHGDPKDRYYLGVPKGEVIVIEDVTTTGGSLIETINNLKEINVDIAATIGLTNRNELRDDKKSVEEVIKEMNVQYYAMSNALQLLPKIYELLQPGIEIGKQVEQYFKKYGQKEITLI